MCRMLLSINPQHVTKILDGSKTFEYRKRMCKRKVDKIVIYSTFPVKRVVGEVEVLDIIEMNKEDLWRATNKNSGITKEYYDQYYINNTKAVAYKLGVVTQYECPVMLDDLGIKMAPQSYMYLVERQ